MTSRVVWQIYGMPIARNIVISWSSGISESIEKELVLLEPIARVEIKFRFAYGTPPVWESPLCLLPHGR